MNKEIIVFDRDKEYLSHFIDYFQDYVGDSMSIQGFTEADSCCQYLMEHEITLLLTYEKAYCAMFIGFSDVRTVLFVEEEHLEEINGVKVVYKYQRAESIIRFILDSCAESLSGSVCANVTRVCDDVEFVGVYSPVKRCGKTAFVLEYAKALAVSKKVLVISMEEYAGSWSQEEGRYNLEDLLYFYLQNSNAFELKLKVVAQRFQTFEIIPPVRNGDELREISFEQWKGFLERIRGSGAYDVIILDISDVIKNILKILALCDYVIMPYVTDVISEKKQKEFQEEWNRHSDEARNRIHAVSMEDVISTHFDSVRLEEKVKRVLANGGELYE